MRALQTGGYKKLLCKLNGRNTFRKTDLRLRKLITLHLLKTNRQFPKGQEQWSVTSVSGKNPGEMLVQRLKRVNQYGFK